MLAKADDFLLESLGCNAATPSFIKQKLQFTIFSNKILTQHPLAMSSAMGLDLVWKANSGASDVFFQLYLLRHKSD